MSFIRFLIATFFAFVSVLFALLVLLYYTPSWQKALLLEALKEDTSRQYQVDYVSARINSVETEDVFVFQDTYGLEIEQINVEIPLWKLVASEIEINGGIIKGVTLDLSSVYISDSTASDWTEFLTRLKEDESFWKYRVGQLIQTLTNYGYTVDAKNVTIQGVVLLTHSESVNFNLFVRKASSDAIDDIDLVLQADPKLNKAQ